MGNNTNKETKPTDFDRSNPLRQSDPVRRNPHNSSLNPPSLQDFPTNHQLKRRNSLFNFGRSSSRRTRNPLAKKDGEVSSQEFTFASVTPQNARKGYPSVTASGTSSRCSPSNSFIIHEEEEILADFPQHQEKRQAVTPQDFQLELRRKLSLRPQVVVEAVHSPEEYSCPEDAIQDSEKSRSQLQISLDISQREEPGFNSLPNSLSRKSGPGTPVGSLGRETKEIKHTQFHHFNRINNESLRKTSKSNTRLPKSSTSLNTMDSDPHRFPDHTKMHRRRSSDKMAADFRGPGQGLQIQQRPVNILRTEGVAIPRRQGVSSISPYGSPRGHVQGFQHQENDGKSYFVAKDCWNGTNDLDVKQNEKLEYIRTLEGGLWYMRSCVTGSKGTVPPYILEPVDSIENQPWFFKNINRRSAEEKLKLAGKHGTFLVRESESTPNDFSLSILDGDTVKHYRIRKHDNGGYYVELTNQFSALQDLVSFYSKDHKGLCSRLAIPCSKEIVRQERVTDEWELDRSLLEIGAVVGRGHFGIVREATLTIPGTNEKFKAAVKELRKGRNDLTEFQKEVNALKSLRHERLIMLYGVCTKEEPYCIVTEFLKNKSLLEYIKGPEGKYLNLEEMLHIALQVAEGMTYLESRNYVHRDLAARNVLLDDRLNSKIADFGMAYNSMKNPRDCNIATPNAEHEGDTERLPIKWTALEALLGGKFTSKSDVWSFGVLLTEIITRGVTPYKDMDNSEVLEFVIKGNRMAQAPGMEIKCYNITLVCWARNPDNRPSFYELQTQLTEYIREVKSRRSNNAFAQEFHG